MSTLIAVSLVALAADGPVEAYAVVDSPVIPFHRQAVYSLVVETDSETEVELPQMVGHFGGLDVYGPPKQSVEVVNGSRRRITESYVLDPVFIGDYVVEPAMVTYGNNETVTVPSVAVRIRDLTEEELDAAMHFEPNAGLVPLREGFWSGWKPWALVGGALALFMGAVLYYVIFRRKQSLIERPQTPPWEVALEKLRVLDQRRLPEAGQWETYYIELSDILRHYIEDRFQLHAPEETTPEFLAEAAGSGLLSEVHQRLLAAFLRHSDRVKFARYEPTSDEMERSFAEVLRFVDETVPIPQPAEEQEETAA